MTTLHHTTLGFCFLDIIAALILLAIIVLFIYKHKKLKDRKEELEEMLADKNADATMDGQGL